MRRSLRTPIALAVLNLLFERPMHPYEMQGLMRERGHDQVIKLAGSSLYSTIERLSGAGLIEPVETTRSGRRPERTVYALTDAGRDEVSRWLEDLIARPEQDYPWFGAALAFLAVLPPESVVRLLEQRIVLLARNVAAIESDLAALAQMPLPRLFGIESEYSLAMRRAELDWVRRLIDDVRAGAVVWPPEALALHAAHAAAIDTVRLGETEGETQ